MWLDIRERARMKPARKPVHKRSVGRKRRRYNSLFIIREMELKRKDLNELH
ncbi:hypothetical protein [Paenibacillus sp. PvR148]